MYSDCLTRPLRAISSGLLHDIDGYIAAPTAYRTVDDLTTAGLVCHEPSVKVEGQKIWMVPAVLTALDEFAERAGRRTYGSSG
ncbi:hypothetical protein RGB72_09505 [Glutamicibacter protophormiae]|uniref:Uncharacterized protein n=1 Tax=Kocuria varians TaxID=1272 RepID=A0A7D7KY37_KOCVA|nr:MULTISPECIES: hypothetical protein [Kocuria]QMS56230.1 hypothetical protein CIB50_0000932 [Kocuria varians]WNB88205.1 hypothetical protein RGB72_09505 [Glutamicibacter protophormiae]